MFLVTNENMGLCLYMRQTNAQTEIQSYKIRDKQMHKHEAQTDKI